MNRTLTLTLSLFLGAAAMAQCTTAIQPTNTTIINASSPASTLNTDHRYWVCPDATGKTVGGGMNYFWIEARTTVFTITGNNNTIYHKSGPIVVNGNANNIFSSDPTNITLNGSNNNPPGNCQTMLFIYGLAPSGGCIPTTGVDELADIELTIAPNPTTDELVLRAGSARVQAIRILDTKGAEVFNLVDDNIAMVHLGGLTPGLYVAVITTTQGTITRRISKL